MSQEYDPFNTGPEVNDVQPSPSKGGRLQRLKLNAGILASAYLALPPELPEGPEPEVHFDETGTIVRHDQEPHLVGTNVTGTPLPETK